MEVEIMDIIETMRKDGKMRKSKDWASIFKIHYTDLEKQFKELERRGQKIQSNGDLWGYKR